VNWRLFLVAVCFVNNCCALQLFATWVLIVSIDYKQDILHFASTCNSMQGR
jgi:hypothetical protein